MNASDFITIFTAILGSGVVTGIVNNWMTRKKRAAEGRSEQVRGELQVVTAATDLVQNLRADAEDLREQLRKLREKVDRLEKDLVAERKESESLRHRVEDLEKENDELRQGKV